jgi:hypothetical protein
MNGDEQICIVEDLEEVGDRARAALGGGRSTAAEWTGIQTELETIVAAIARMLAAR